MMTHVHEYADETSNVSTLLRLAGSITEYLDTDTKTTEYVIDPLPRHMQAADFNTKYVDPVPRPVQVPDINTSTIQAPLVDNNINIKEPICKGPLKSCQKMKPSVYMDIIEQPQSVIRFRYKSEGRFPGGSGLFGASSKPKKETWPTIRIVGHTGPFAVVVSCVTKDKPYYAHPYKLVSKEEDTKGGEPNGYYFVVVENESREVTFPRMGIQCVLKKEITTSLKARDRFDPFKKGFKHQFTPEELIAVRLCFQAYDINYPYSRLCEPVVSVPIYNAEKRSPLVIHKMAPSSAPASKPGEGVILCDKISKNDIEVVFYEFNENNTEVWKRIGTFKPDTDVHKNVAICFKIPRYTNTIEKGRVAKVLVELRRPSDGERSDSIIFTYTTADSDLSMPSTSGDAASPDPVSVENMLSSSDLMKLSDGVSNMSIG